MLTSPTKLALAAAAAVFLAVCAFSINKPLTTDESEFAASAIGILTWGKPIYYMGDTPERFIPDSDRWIYHSTPTPGFQYGLWHSSFYPHVLAASYRLFGRENWAARLPGAICFLITLGLLGRIIKMIYTEDESGRIFGITAILALVNPLLVQQSLMVDLDNTLVTAAVVLVLSEYIRMELRELHWIRKYLWLALLLAGSFWTKELTGFYLAAAIGLYELLARRWARAAGVIGALVLGISIFWITWRVYCAALDLPPAYFIQFSLLRRLAGSAGTFMDIYSSEGAGALAYKILYGLVHSAVWVSPFFAALGLIAVGWRLREFFRTKKPAPIDLLLIFALGVLTAAKLARPSGSLLKYEYPAYPLITLLIAAMAVRWLDLSRWRGIVLSGVLALGLAVFQSVVFADPVQLFFDDAPYNILLPPLSVSYLLAFVLVWTLVRYARPKVSFAAVTIPALLIAALGANLGADWRQRRPYVTVLAWNNYGEANLEETAKYLKSRLRPGDVPVCRKDIGFYLNKDLPIPHRRWVNTAVIQQSRSSEDLLAEILKPEISHIVLDKFSRRFAALPDILRHFTLVENFGGFQVYQRVRPVNQSVE